MPWPVHPNGLLGASGDNDTYQVSRSLRFNSPDSAYLNRTPASITNQKTYTFNFWFKRSELGSQQEIFSALFASTSLRYAYIGFSPSDTLEVFTGIYSLGASTTTSYNYETTQVFRDTSAWYMITVAVDTTNATASDRVKIYANGTQVTSFSTAIQPALNQNGYWNSTQFHGIGTFNASISFFDGYLAEVNFIDGLQLTPSSFSETDSFTGRLKAKAYSGSYGTNGYYLKFADNSAATAATIGKDSSVNANNWTPNAISVTAGPGNDSLVDSPTNYGLDSYNTTVDNARGNYCGLNPLAISGGSLANGNLDYSTTNVIRSVVASTGVTSGKWYWEVRANLTDATQAGMIGITTNPDALISSVTYVGANTTSYSIYQRDGFKYNNGTATAYGSSYLTAGDIVMVALDMGSGKVWFGLNGTWASSGNPATGVNEAFSGISGTAFPAIGNSTLTAGFNTDMSVNFGQRLFAYNMPAGYKTLCTTNLPTPTIKKPSSYFDALAYTGTGASNSISSLGFSPDLVWIKNRGGATSNALYDTTRLATKQLSSDTTGDEATSSTGLTAFDSNGFTLGTSTLVNTSGTQYVAWAWDEAPIAGLDIVSYTGTGANATIPHNLGVAPKMLIVKARTTAGADQGWPVWHESIANTTYLQLNSTAATATGTNYWNSTSPTSSVFSVGTNAAVNTSADTYIAYAFAEVEGFSKIGSYTGNANANGPFVYCGFRPSFILIKSRTAVDAWLIYDNERNTFNVASSNLVPNTSAAEATISGIDFVSNGFKLRTITTTPNAAQTYIFAAFAESPFKYARAR
jgi:hypothetical protein